MLVKCSGCGMMMEEDLICDSMEEDTCYNTYAEDEVKELNFSHKEVSNPFDQQDHSDREPMFTEEELEEGFDNDETK